MYCEIIVKHRKRIDAGKLEGAIRVPFGNNILILDAYAEGECNLQKVLCHRLPRPTRLLRLPPSSRLKPC